MKDRTKFEQRHNEEFFTHCPNGACNEKYVRESDRRIIEQIIDHNKWDENSYLLKRTCGSHYTHVWRDNCKILNGSYESSAKREMNEVLYIKALKPILVVKEKTFGLELYN